MIDDNARISDDAIFRDAPDVVVREKENSVSAISNSVFALGQAMEFF